MFKRWMIICGIALAFAVPATGLAQDKGQDKEQNKAGASRTAQAETERGKAGARDNDKDKDRDRDRDREERGRDHDDDHDQNKVTVSLTAPANHTVVTAPGTVALTAAASASHRNWAILRVEFYRGATLIGSATAAPYTITWTNAPAGNYTLTAKAIAINRGQDKDKENGKDKDHRNSPVWEAVSAPVSLTVNAPPSVGLTGPTAGQSYIAPASVTLTANAADSDGTIAKVEFYQGSTLLGTATAAPYAVTWPNAPAGQYTLTAKATDDKGATTTSSPIIITVDAPPSVTLTGPTANQSYIAPASVILTANAADADGTVAKVEFYQGSALIGTATAAPFTATWTNAPAGTYTLTAKATDDKGATTTSSPIIITVDAPPSVTLTSPTANQSYIAPASVTLTANAADTDGTVAKVEFYQGATLIGTATAAPYTATWQNVPAGTYTITAKATDDKGATTTSAPIQISIDAPPTVSLTSPTANQSYIAPASVTLTANAADADGTIAKVEFYQGATLIGTATAAPYTATWANAPAGTYTLTAKATDDKGAITTSAPAQITVIPNQLPSITLTGPTANQRFIAPATITLASSAQDMDGQIARVEYYQGATLIGTATAAPYIATWQNVPEGQYSLTAKAIDNGGGETYSSTVSITVAPAGLKVYYLHSDHLNTPRVVTDEQNRIVWRNSPLAEPFGTAAPEQDPDGDGMPFTLNLRFPGQYYDRETGLNYNYFRDYNPETGRYVQSDPIGLEGGINTYAYVENNPVNYIDPEGLFFMTTVGGLQRGTSLNQAVQQGAPGSAAAIAGLATIGAGAVAAAGQQATGAIIAAGLPGMPTGIKGVILRRVISNIITNGPSGQCVPPPRVPTFPTATRPPISAPLNPP